MANPEKVILTVLTPHKRGYDGTVLREVMCKDFAAVGRSVQDFGVQAKSNRSHAPGGKTLGIQELKDISVARVLIQAYPHGSAVASKSGVK